MRLAPALYAATLFLSALLLFAVQPMFTKMVLPRLGGAPTVWSVAMVFFQAALLAGYAYAHLLVRRLPLGIGALVHLGVLAAAAVALPIGIAHGFGAPPATGIALWLIGLFAALDRAAVRRAVGERAAAAGLVRRERASAGAQPLRALCRLQSRLVRRADRLSGRDRAAAARCGSRRSSGRSGFAVLAVADRARRPVRRARRAIAVDAQPTTAPRRRWRDRLAWMALAAIPAGLVIAVTAYITTDIAAAPFLWVLPLALYLLTFVACSATGRGSRTRRSLRLVPFAGRAARDRPARRRQGVLAGR